ncbi:MAG: bifunctional diaminohydroxyphosphoribosylaminopyrimidine deaminase/5-amino-6-(5-phosphoribosylamino)uracil reductase RibD [candidate division WOR-3 bacterium]|nr:bifunctional diaminohydroxyphosphoribosylaminopyrimidine deaminase/5-amino-6-(5-phosphoribosylamino)uracil reductase RibD [candidate division WOR-3 bacterium]
MKDNELYMNRAIELALKAKGKTSPNPLVGAVIVKDNKIIAEGYHKGAGKPHAEIEAIKKAGTDASGSDLYITLEPCNFHGRTPPCIDTIKTIDFRRIIIGMIDPNPRVNGKSVEFLRKRGYEVVTGILEDKIRKLNPYYKFFIENRRPFVVMKIAQSIDGYIAPARNRKVYLTCESSRREVHRIRGGIDGILIGSGTINIDNPILDARLIDKNYKPAVIIADFSNELDYNADIINDGSRRKYVIVSSQYRNRIEKRENTEYIFVDSKADSWDKLRTMMPERNIISILVEGGAGVFSSAIENRSYDELTVFTAPLILGSGVRAIETESMQKLELIEHSLVDGDVMMRYRCLPD